MNTIRALFVLVAPVLISTATGQPQNIPVCNKPGDQAETFIAISPINQNYMLAVWDDFRAGAPTAGYAFSLDGGTTWRDSFFLTPGAARMGDPNCAFDRRGNAFYANIGFSNSNNRFEPWVSRTRTFQPSGDWHQTRVASVGADAPSIAVDNTGGTRDGSVYVTYRNTSGGNGGIQFAYSRDTANTFVVLPDTLAGSDTPGWSSVVAVGPNGDVYLVWWKYELQTIQSLKFRKSTDGGATFQSFVIIGTTYIYRGNNLLHPAIGVDPVGGNIYVVYNDYVSLQSQTPRIKFVYSTNGGATWSIPVLVDQVNNTNQARPALSVSADGRANISYDVIFNSSIQDIYTTATWDWGTTFQVPQRTTDTASDNLNHAPGSQDDYMGMTSTTTRAFPLWTDYRHSNTDIYTAGVSFPNLFNFATAYGSTPKTVYSSNTGLWNTIFSSNGSLYYTSSSNDGTTWSTPQGISGLASVQISSDPVIVQDGSGNLDVVFASAQGLYYCKKSQNGSWSSPVQLYSSSQTSYPTMAVDASGTGHVVFVNYGSGLGFHPLSPGQNWYLLYGTFSTANPGLLTLQKQIEGPVAQISGTSLTQLVTGQLHAVWSRSGEIYYSYGSGSNWPSPVNISNNSGSSLYPSILSYSDGTNYSLNVVWQDNTPGNYDIFSLQNSNGSWYPATNISNNSGSSLYPFIGNYKYLGSYDTQLIMWADNTNQGTNYDIYYSWLGGAPHVLTSTSQSSLYPSFTQRPISGGSRILAIWTEYPNKVLSTYIDQPLGKRATAAQRHPDKYELFPSYPNPFNPSTTIRYRLPLQSAVTLKVYDPLGREVATLVNEILPPGDYTKSWDAGGLSGGVYFYRLHAGRFSDVKKMLLIR